jgi:selenocysteine lyase/cysteine desulfurase
MSELRRLWDGLAEIRKVRVFGPPPTAPRTPTVSFQVVGHDAAEVSHDFAEHGLFVSSGDFYASTAIGRLGLNEQGLVRVGCSIYTTRDEVDRLLEAVRDYPRLPR